MGSGKAGLNHGKTSQDVSRRVVDCASAGVLTVPADAVYYGLACPGCGRHLALKVNRAQPSPKSEPDATGTLARILPGSWSVRFRYSLKGEAPAVVGWFGFARSKADAIECAIGDTFSGGKHGPLHSLQMLEARAL